MDITLAMDIPKPNKEECLTYHEELVTWCRATALGMVRHSALGAVGLETARQVVAVESHRQVFPSDALLPFRRVGIIGAGLMGASIAAWHLAKGCQVVITDNSQASLQTVRERVTDELKRLAADGKTTCEARFEDFQISDCLGDLARCDCVIESIIEDANAKTQLFRQLEEQLGAETPILSNTSTIPIVRLASGLQHSGRVCGLHFLHPVRSRELVEVIPHAATHSAITGRVVEHALAIGKLPVIAGDTPGFVVNRLLFPYLNEGLQLITEGILPDVVDRAAVEMGFLMGPIRIMDEIGLDTTWSAGRVLWEAFPERITPSPILVSMLKHKRMGRKNNRGFFDYSVCSPSEVELAMDAETQRLITPWMASPPLPQKLPVGIRLALSMAFEAALILADNVADDPRIVDACAVLGLGFPQSLGGPWFWLTSLGFSQVKGIVKATCPPTIARKVLKALERVAQK